MPKKKKQRYYPIKSYIVSVFFVSIIWLPLADNLFHVAPKVTLTENRYLEKFPAFSMKGLIDAEFFKEAEEINHCNETNTAQDGCRNE